MYLCNVIQVSMGSIGLPALVPEPANREVLLRLSLSGTEEVKGLVSFQIEIK